MFAKNSPQASPLGKHSDYQDQYAPELLFPIPRAPKRQEIGINTQNLPFFGVDLWTAYEFSWLNLKGKPQVAILFLEVPANSPNIIESKSLKLYLNSYNQTRLKDADTAVAQLNFDLSAAAAAPVRVQLQTPADFARLQIQNLPGNNIDHHDIDIDHYTPQPQYLRTENHEVREVLCSDLLKSNCLVTKQPDWASIAIDYQGKKICEESLLKYLVSFRQHNEFHEQCVERIFYDIMRFCSPEKLTVYARYTRRGGCDINPWRSNDPQQSPPANQRTARQ